MHLLTLLRDETPEQVEELRSYCKSLTLIEPSITWEKKAQRVLKSGWRKPWMLGRRTHHEMIQQIEFICHLNRIDLVHLAWTETARYLASVPFGVGCVLGTFDVEYIVRPREVRLYSSITNRLKAILRMRQLISIERSALHHQGIVTLACSERDREHLLGLEPSAHVHVVPPWIGLTDAIKLTTEGIIPGRLTFMGAMDRIANVASVRFLLDMVWPQIRQMAPEATFRVVGAHPPAWLVAQANDNPQLTVTGYVPDLVSEWQNTDVAVSPSLTGGGLIIKVAQPMAAGRPVVTTTLGNEGVDAPKGTAVEVADDPASFVEAIVRLLSDRAHWYEVASAGHDHVLSRFDWEYCIDQLESAYEAALSQVKVR